MAASCKVGTGAGSPSASDTVLPGFLATVGRSNGAGAFQVTTAPYYFEVTYTYLFNLGAINATLTCIGVHNSGAGSNIFAWSQIKDSSNVPTTLTVLATEQLQVTYKFRVYAPTFTTSGSILVAGDATHNFIMYAHSFGSGRFGNVNGSCIPVITVLDAYRWDSVTPPASITANPVYTNASAVQMSITNGSYTPGSFTRQITGFLSTSSNVTGNTIKGFVLRTAPSSYGPEYLIVLSTFIPKDNTKTLTITYSYSIARYP